MNARATRQLLAAAVGVDVMDTWAKLILRLLRYREDVRRINKRLAMRYVWGIAFFVLFLFSLVLTDLFLDAVGLTDVIKPNSTQQQQQINNVFSQINTVFFLLFAIWGLTPLPRPPGPEKPPSAIVKFVVSTKMASRMYVGVVTAVGLAAGVGLLIIRSGWPSVMRNFP
jgi:hypothetical protein